MTPCFALDSGDGRYPQGWVLVQARLCRRSPDCSSCLYLDFDVAFDRPLRLDIPAKKKGVIHELLFFPSGITGMRWAPMHSAGAFDQWPILITEIGALERIFHMVVRVVALVALKSKKTIDALGLGWKSVLSDLPQAYRLAGRLRACAPPPSYEEWIRNTETLTAQDHAGIRQHISRFRFAPRFVLMIDVADGDAGELARTLESVRRQYYLKGDIVLLNADAGVVLPDGFPEGDGGILNVGRAETPLFMRQLISSSTVDDSLPYVIFVRSGDRLAELALYRIASAVEEVADAVVIYSDDDCLDEGGARCEPRFKPDWSPELLRSTNYMGQFVAIRMDVLARAGGVTPHELGGDNHAMLLRVCATLSPEEIVHVPEVLIHRQQLPAPAGVEVIRDHLVREGVTAEVHETLPGCYWLRYELPQPLPMVTIIVPTRDALHLLAQCVESILSKSRYPNYEIIVVDNQSSDPAALEYLAAIEQNPKIRVLRYDAPFNYSAINNFAAEHAGGDVLCLLNNDIEVISLDWMEEMVGHLVQEGVGIVGAKLLYPDGLVQHGGDVLGVGGIANHLHVFLGRNDPGYCNRAVLAQDLSAVTGACLMTWRNLYLDLGGLDEEHLPVAFNDVDYCLRVREAGHRVVWTPHAELYHHESATRGSDDTPAKKRRARKEAAWMRRRWGEVLRHDPFYNPNLSYERADFSLSHAPLKRKPWRER